MSIHTNHPSPVEAPLAADALPVLDLIKVPHGEGGDFNADAGYIVAEAMRLTAEGGVGRAKFRDGAKLAIASLLAQGWTPPGAEGADEAARLRTALAAMQQRLDEAGAGAIRAAEAERRAEGRRAAMVESLHRGAASLRERSNVARADGEPEPTLTFTEIAKVLEKALARNRR